MGPQKFNGKSNIISKNILKYRLIRNMSQADICRELSLMGVTLYRNDIFKIEHSKRYIRDFEIYALTKVLNISLEQLFEDVDSNFHFD